MTAGRELDALVAEKVMGWTVSRDPVWQRVYEQPDDLVETSQDKTLRRTLQPYSTDITAAWEVVEKVGHTWLIAGPFRTDTLGYEWRAGTSDWFERADTAPLAICLAALKAIGHLE